MPTATDTTNSNNIPKSVQVNIAFSGKLYEKILKHAKELGIKDTELIRFAVAKLLKDE